MIPVIKLKECDENVLGSLTSSVLVFDTSWLDFTRLDTSLLTQ